MTSGAENHNQLRRLGHRIDDVVYGAKAGPSSMLCSCGVGLQAGSPMALDWAFREHRREVGARTAQLSDGRVAG